MYAVSFSMLAGQYLVGDVFGITLKSSSGVPIKSDLLNSTNISTLNTMSKNLITNNYTVTDVARAFVVAGLVVKDLLLLMTGTYIFNVLLLLGVPAIIVTPLIFLYLILLARAIIGYIRGL